jgi:hypothetical protein
MLPASESGAPRRWRVLSQGVRWFASVSQAVSKTRRTRWVPVPAEVFAAVVERVPREDRDLEAPVFAGFGVDRFRTAIGRACKASGVPVFSPHDVRHRRATLWHLQGVPAAEAAAWLGHSPQEHLATYAQATLVDRDELEYVVLLGGGFGEMSPSEKAVSAERDPRERGHADSEDVGGHAGAAGTAAGVEGGCDIGALVQERQSASLRTFQHPSQCKRTALDAPTVHPSVHPAAVEVAS